MITLGIIGVVAAMTLPLLITRHQKQVTVTKLKKAYSALSQMVIRTYADNGAVSDFLTTGEDVDANKTKQFFETYWLPYFNGPIVANPKFYSTESPFLYLNGDKNIYGFYTNYNEGRISFSTQDGIIYHINIMAWVYDEAGNMTPEAVYSTYSSVIVDINGTNPPNTYGKDVFRFVIDFNNNVVKSYCNDNSMTSINNNCNKSNTGACCAAKIIKDGWQITSDYPW